ncbi:phage tail protein [Lusitaniella coriacea LEGE 07157]|uniref:Phage tail protein n=1 Tax=Lusitaniella coriacea LEGE 07157 TaxID=945747 RepID=A0A8J7DWD3_9CYAN|nr:phage tail protein [Lusitaniella coriacea]MBE9116391.1 phage tail protein [Lusitaniella coriacea LEGE 07157]
MSDSFPIPAISLTKNPPVGFSFMVTFLIGGFVPNPLDIRFQRVSGISSTMETTEIREGGENLFSLRLPTRMTYGNLVLERGMVIGSSLNIEFNLAMSTMSFQPGNVLVMLLNAKDIPIASWLFQETYPVTWSVSDLDANQSSIVIDTMELAYARLQSLRI